jgi:UDP-N-acetylmuramoyl-tripeptide--D-alanyl-D-alanine ligase
VRIEDIITAIENYIPGNNRSEIRKTESNTLICDSYNANPTSMAMAIKSFNEIKDVKKAMILGDMLELGEKSEDEHRKILEMISHSGNQEVLLVGHEFRKIAADYGLKAFKDTAELVDYLTNNPIEGRAVLIKGSRGIALEKVYYLL